MYHRPVPLMICDTKWLSHFAESLDTDFCLPFMCIASSWLNKACRPGRTTKPDQVKIYDDVIKWKHFPRYWPFVRGIHRSPVNSPHKGQWHGALMFSLICVWINVWVNNREVGDLRRYRAHYDVIVMKSFEDWVSVDVRRVSDLRMSYNDLTWIIGCQYISPKNGR